MSGQTKTSVRNLNRDVRSLAKKKRKVEIFDPKKTIPVEKTTYHLGKKPIFVVSTPIKETDRNEIIKKGKSPNTMRHFWEAQFHSKRNQNYLFIGTEVRTDNAKPLRCSFEIPATETAETTT